MLFRSVVSYIGYTPQEVAINGKNKLDIHLLEDTKTLDEVVVVGYGVQKKSHLTGSVSKMDINNLTDIPVTQVDQLLQGKIAGVNIQNSTSEAGAAPQIRVRGMGSISAVFTSMCFSTAITNGLLSKSPRKIGRAHV